MSSSTELPLDQDAHAAVASISTPEDRARRRWMVVGLLAAAACIVGLSTGAASPPVQRLGTTGVVAAANQQLPTPTAPLLAAFGSTLERAAAHPSPQLAHDH